MCHVSCRYYPILIRTGASKEEKWCVLKHQCLYAHRSLTTILVKQCMIPKISSEKKQYHPSILIKIPFHVARVIYHLYSKPI